MHCDEVKKSLMTYIDGKFSDAESGRIKRHLDACPLCRSEYADEVEFSAAFSADTAGLAGVYFTEDVMGSIDTALQKEYDKVRIPPALPWVATIGVIIAAIASGLILHIGGSPYISQAQAALIYWAGIIHETVAELYLSAMGYAEVASSGVASLTGQYVMYYAIGAAITAGLCIALIGGFRRKLIEEFGR